MSFFAELFDRSRTAVAIALWGFLAASFAPLALAQDDDGAETDEETVEALEEVVVYGIRGALENALAEKRNADNIVEIITAEDVGKLPDQNLAEVLENITGVQIDRNQGIGSSVSIRGSDQNRVELNGRGTTPSSDNRGGISFEDLPSELIAAVKVTKVPTADMVEGSLGGTVDLKTYRPLRLKNPIRALNYRSEYTQNRDEYAPSYSGTFGDNWSTGAGDMGLVVNATVSARDVREDSSNVRLYPRTNQDLDGDGVNDPYLTPGFSQQFNGMSDRKTTALNTSFEWQATETFRFFLDGTYSDAEIQQRGVYTAFGTPGSAGERPNIDTAVFRDYVAPNGTVIPILMQGQIDGIQIRSQNASASRYTKSSVYALGGEWNREAWTVRAEASRSESDSAQPQFRLNIQYQDPDAANPDSAGARQRVDFYYDATGPIAYGPADPSAYDFLDPNSWAAFIFRDNARWHENFDDTQKIDVEYDVGGSFLSSVQFGVRGSTRKSAREALSQVSDGWPGISGAELAPWLTQTPADTMDFNSGASYLSSYLVPDPDLLRDPTAIRAELGLDTEPTNDRLQAFSVTEDTLAGYLRLNFDTEWGSWPVRGNVGVRWVGTDQTAQGVQYGPGFPPDGELVDVTHDYSEALPSLSLVLAPTDTLLVRLAAAKILRRPNFGNLSPTVRFPTNNNPVRQGNPYLEPTTATQYDLSFEYYFRKGSLMHVGLFHKDLAEVIGEERFFNAIYNPNAPDPVTGEQGAFVDLIRPTNVPGGEINGIELSLQHSFDHLDGFWGGFGTILNYTYQDGERDLTFNIPGYLRVDGEDIEFPLGLRGLSEESYNMTLYYETARFAARLRYTYRDGFLRNESIGTAAGFPLYQLERSQMNGNLAWNINDQFTLTLAGVNLTKERNDEAMLFADGPIVQMRDSDRRIILGLRARF